MPEEFSFLLRLGEAESHWLKMTCINQFLRQTDSFAANVEMWQLNRVPGGGNE